MAARSNPPTLLKTSRASFLLGLCRAKARVTTCFFRRKPASVMPPPRPVTASTGSPVRAASTAAEVVVLPMPISPTPKTATPSALARRASSMPVQTAWAVSCRVMAGSRARLRVPGLIFRFTISGQWYSSAMPTSTTCTWSPKWWAMALMPVQWRVIFTAWAAVTLRGVTDTPSSTTPLSAQRTMIRQGV